MYAVLCRAAPLRRRAVPALLQQQPGAALAPRAPPTLTATTAAWFHSSPAWLGFRETGAAGAAARPQFVAEEGSFYEDNKRAPAVGAAAAAEGLEIANLGISSKIVERLPSKGITKLFPNQTLGLLRGSTHVRSYSSQLSALIPATSQCSNLTRKRCYLPNPSLYQVWSRSFASDNGDKFEAVVPFMGESVTDGTLANFLKKPGDRVEADEPIAQIETDKVTIDVASPEAGVIEKLIASEGDTVTPGTKVAIISKSAQPAETHVAPSEEATPKESSPPKVEEKPKVEAPKVEPPKMQAPKHTAPSKTSPSEPQLPPKERERRVPMPRLRKRIANRLKDSQNTFAMLTTFNEVDMTNLMKLRSDYKDEFVTKHGVKLGLMSCFVKAAVSALQNQPIVNAVIDGDDIIYRDYVDVSVAVGTSKGLVVPVIRDADTMNFADIEKGINNLAKKATEGALSIDDMAGGTFTISNGGVYGSLISTPIINPPQSAILGMHSIVQRPVVVNGDILARPMMYLALTYDHRLIDGREAVFFLRRIKDVVEDPRRLLLDI